MSVSGEKNDKHYLLWNYNWYQWNDTLSCVLKKGEQINIETWVTGWRRVGGKGGRGLGRGQRPLVTRETEILKKTSKSYTHSSTP